MNQPARPGRRMLSSKEESAVALPKRRHSRARKAKRRTHFKLTSPSTSSCSHCGQPKRPHRVCQSCGYYADREITTPEIA